MNRYDIEFTDGKHIKWYANTEQEARNKTKWYECKIKDINLITNPEYLKYIEQIKQSSKLVSDITKGNTKREYYFMSNHNGKFDIFVNKDIRDNMYYETLQFRQVTGREFIVPILRSMTTAQEFCETFLDEPYRYERLSYRKYGQPKLSTPKELSKIKQVFSGEYIPKKCNCPCYIKGNDLFIKHKDFFSPEICNEEDIGTPLNYRLKKYGMATKNEKFCYADNWGAIVARCEAWIVFRNIIPTILREDESQASRLLLELFENNDKMAQIELKNYISFENQWLRFFEDITKKVQNHYKN